MKAFRFRAQAALDLRRKEDEEARRALAAARAAVSAAHAALETVTHDLAEALARARDVEATASEVAVQMWHRNWIRTRQEFVSRHRKVLERRRAESEVVAVKAQETRRRLRALEKLRERAWRTYGRAVAHEEQRELDLFGSLQFAVRRIASRGD